MQNSQNIFTPIHRFVFGVALCAMALLGGCESAPKPVVTQAPGQPTTTTQPSGQPIGEVKTTTKIGPAKLSLEQVQADVEAFVDRYVLTASQATDEAKQENPEFREALHELKLSIASGGYTIAAGPNSLVSLLDIIVQSTLVRNSVEKNLAARLPESSGAKLLAVFTRLEKEAWAIGERTLEPQEIADLRILVDTWIQENPDLVYVAGIRFADFSRLRPKEGKTLPSSVFGLLRIDPFASISPAAREAHEARLLAERFFYYMQRMPQLIDWQSERLYYNLAGARETRQALTNLDEFADSTRIMTEKVDQLPAKIRQELEASETSVNTILSRIDTSLGEARSTLAEIDEAAAMLQETGNSITEAGRAWEQTVNSFGEIVTTLSPPDDPNAPPSEPVSVHDIINGIKEAQATAVELRQLLNELNSTVQSGNIENSVASSVAETRRGAQSIIITITTCVVIVIVFIVISAIVYRLLAARLTGTRPA